MKKCLIILLLTVCAAGAFAQCNPYYFMQNNGSWELTMYNQKGKISGKQVNKVVSYNELNDGWKATIKSAYLNKKDKLQHEGEFDLECDNGKILMDLERLMPQESLESFKAMNMKMSGENLTIPENLEVGQELPPASLKLSGDTPVGLEVKIFDRKVEGIETVTVPAGTFECYKITYKMQMNTIFTMETSGIEYVAEKVGLVKQESYAKNGKLSGYSELTNYSF